MLYHRNDAEFIEPRMQMKNQDQKILFSAVKITFSQMSLACNMGIKLISPEVWKNKTNCTH